MEVRCRTHGYNQLFGHNWLLYYKNLHGFNEHMYIEGPLEFVITEFNCNKSTLT